MDASCNQLIGRWHINQWECYLLVCFVGAIALRPLQGLFKAWALKYDDVPCEQKNSHQGNDKGYWRIYLKHVKGFALGKSSDLWLPTIIGFIELAVYPILLALGQIVIVGAWMGIKTAGAWSGWKTSTTAFNRFLLFNILNLLIAYFLARLVQKVPC
jgi:hypothetical protein